MQSEADNQPAHLPPAGSGPVTPDFTRPLRPVTELLTDDSFPRNALGEFLDIGGYTGVVVEIVGHSLRVRSPEGVTKSFNVNGLKRIYGPRVLPEPIPVPSYDRPPASRPAPASPWPSSSRLASAPAPEKEQALEPDFTKPVRNINEFVRRPDYPQCVLGEHIDISGYTGVVVQIVNRSLKVRSPAETTRSYNADALRRLFSP